MRLRPTTPLFVVSKDGSTDSDLNRLANMVKGGMSLDEVEVFTTKGEAARAVTANTRRSKVEQFESDEILSASSLALLGASGRVIERIEFCASDH